MDTSTKSGVVAEVREFLSACAQYAWARLRLATAESKEAGAHALKLLVFALGALALMVFAYIFLCLAVVFLIARGIGGPNSWIWASLIMAGIHLAVTIVLALAAKNGLKRPLFPLTTNELKKDQEWLKTKHN